MGGWNGWYHVTVGTYGTWLPGDPRGWRARGAKEWVEGDYRNPPPRGKYAGLHAAAGESMVQEPVLLDKQERAILVKAFREAFDRNGVTPIVISCDAVHVHLLARFPDEGIRTRVAVAKRHSTFRLKKCGRSGKVWARRCGVHPVRDRRHQVATFGYILKHKDKGALVWTFRQEQGSDLSMELL